MKRIVLLCFVCLCFLAAPIGAFAKKLPEINMNLLNFVTNYDKGATSIKLPKIDIGNMKVSRSEFELYEIPLTDVSLVQVTTNLGRKQVARILFIGAGKGTQESGARIMASLLNVIMAVTPDLTPEQRKPILEKLGLLGGVEDGQERSTVVKGLEFMLQVSPTVGVLLGVEPVQ